MEGRGRMESGGNNEGPTTTKGERRKWIRGREGKRKGFAGPMSNCFLRPCQRCELWESCFILLPPCKHVTGTWSERFCQVQRCCHLPEHHAGCIECC